MTTATQLSTYPAWAKPLAKPAAEFSATQLRLLSGKIPQGLRGTLYRNGPGRLEFAGVRMGHWFDGDGAVLGIHFTDAGATGVYRYVQTAGYQKETSAGQLLYGNYGMTAPGPVWNQWFKSVKNVGNTSVLALPDKLLALWEAGQPHALDLQTLDTVGLDNLTQLGDRLTYSAHPKRDSHTGEIFNFGVSSGRKTQLNVYKSDHTGKILQKATVQLEGSPLVHDFVLAGQYLVFFIPPVRLNVIPVLLGISSYSDALEWKPQLGTQFFVLDRDTLSVVSRGETEPWYQWHFANGYVDASGAIIVDVVRYEDFQTNQYLKEIATGQTHTAAKSTLWQVHLDPSAFQVTSIQEVLDRPCEFPTVPPSNVGQASYHTYLTVHRDGVDISKEQFGAIARFDYQTDTLTIADFGENRYPSEPIYVSDALNSQQGWVITVVYDGNTDQSEVWVYDSDQLDAEPVCQLRLPSVIPLGFHGTWKPA